MLSMSLSTPSAAAAIPTVDFSEACAGYAALAAELDAEYAESYELHHRALFTERLLDALQTTTDPKALLAFASHDRQLIADVPAVEAFCGDDVALEELKDSLRSTATTLRNAIFARGYGDITDSHFVGMRKLASEFDAAATHSLADLQRRLAAALQNPQAFDIPVSGSLIAIVAPQALERMATAVNGGEAFIALMASGLPKSRYEMPAYYKKLAEAIRPYNEFWRINIWEDGKIRIVNNGDGKMRAGFVGTWSLTHVPIITAPIAIYLTRKGPAGIPKAGRGRSLRELGFHDAAGVNAALHRLQAQIRMVKFTEDLHRAVMGLMQEKARRAGAGDAEGAKIAAQVANQTWYVGRWFIGKTLVAATQMGINAFESITKRLEAHRPAS